MKLSDKAINDLRMSLQTLYGADFGLSDDDLNEIGLFLLTGLAEGLKHNKYGIIKNQYEDIWITILP
jgi:hypothetical protein